ncbi:MAG: DUF2808 domain-containing protein [Symploca sp. SIO2B6]|nr:DUF2808 domain-containing protein [Symploca sp. SIO2B6]
MMKQIHLRQIKLWVVATMVAIGVMMTGVPIQAIQLADGTVYFAVPPRLVDASITRQSVADSNVAYYFDLAIPNDAGESLQQIEITQRDADLFTREVDFELDKSQAFVGRRRDRHQELGIGTTTYNEDTHTVTVTLDPPVLPGTELTLRLKANRNPRRSGVYLFGVTAYPEGAIAHGQFLGFGRFHIYDNDHYHWRSLV